MAIKRGTIRGETINGTGFADSLFGLGGNDILNGLAGNDTLDGGTGNDTLRGGLGNDRLLGGIGNDRLFGDANNDTLIGGANDDLLQGGDGNDVLMPGAGTNSSFGGLGTDFLSFLDLAAAPGTIVLEGDRTVTVGGATVATGIEGIIGSQASDLMLVGLGGIAYGGGGNDQISARQDPVPPGSVRVMRGDGGNDFLFGATGPGGGGAPIDTDHFWLQYDKGFDRIFSFGTGQDKLRVSAAEFNLAAGLAGQPLPAAAFLSGAGNIAASPFHRFILDTTTGYLYADKDGSGSVFASVLIATGLPTATANDFLIIA